jgi:tetratricopeptide (TPR) repeat protein
MRVESVAWVTERKDVLFGAFYLSALYYYIKGVIAQKPSKHIVLILVLFLLSGLSKIQAVTLPLSMLTIDYLLGRRLSWKRITEKWMYFAVSLFIGLLGIAFLQEQGSIGTVTSYAFYDRLFVGSYSYIVYFMKLFVPYPLLPLYPYPPSLGAKFYLSMIPALGIIAFTYWAYLKEWKALVFGIAFFTFNIMFLLQIIGAGQGFIADRFTYIAYFGFFFTISFYLQKVYTNKKRGQIINGGIALYLLVFAYITYNQNKIWKNSGTLWTHELKYYDNTRLPWGNRANYYRDTNQRTKALQDYGRALALDQTVPDPYNSRGKLFFMSNSVDTVNMALQDYTSAITIDPTFAEYHMNRGATYARLQNFNAALNDLLKAGELDPNNPTIYFNRSIVYHSLGQYQLELNDINRYLELDANNGNMWANRANTKMLLGQWDTALVDINQAIALDPNAGVYYYYRAQFYYNTGNTAAAQQDINTSKQLGFAFNGSLENLRM